MEDDIIKVMKNLVTKIERGDHQAQLGRRNCMEPVKTSMEKKILGGNAQEDYVMIEQGE